MATAAPPEELSYHGAQQATGKVLNIHHQIGSLSNPLNYADGKGYTSGHPKINAELVAIGELVRTS